MLLFHKIVITTENDSEDFIRIRKYLTKNYPFPFIYFKSTSTFTPNQHCAHSGRGGKSHILFYSATRFPPCIQRKQNKTKKHKKPVFFPCFCLSFPLHNRPKPGFCFFSAAVPALVNVSDDGLVVKSNK